MAVQKDSLELGRRIDVYVGRKIAQSMCKKGIGIEQMSSHLGMPSRQVDGYLSGRSRLGAGRLFEMAIFLQVPASEWFPSLTCEELLEDENSRGIHHERALDPKLRVYLNTGNKSIAVDGDKVKVAVNASV